MRQDPGQPAAELNGNSDRLAESKPSLREWLSGSPLCDGRAFAAAIFVMLPEPRDVGYPIEARRSQRESLKFFGRRPILNSERK
jgi:hypothetical protein